MFARRAVLSLPMGGAESCLIDVDVFLAARVLEASSCALRYGFVSISVCRIAVQASSSFESLGDGCLCVDGLNFWIEFTEPSQLCRTDSVPIRALREAVVQPVDSLPVERLVSALACPAKERAGALSSAGLQKKTGVRCG